MQKLGFCPNQGGGVSDRIPSFCWNCPTPNLPAWNCPFLANAISDLMVRMGWPVNIVNLKAVHQMRLNNISGSLPIWPLPAIIIIIVKLIVIIISYQRSRSLTWSPSSTVWPPWSQQSAPFQETSTSAPSFQLSTCSSIIMIIIFLRRVYSYSISIAKTYLLGKKTLVKPKAEVFVESK